MTYEVLGARARGLGTRSFPEPAGSPRAIEDRLRDRAAAELAILARWGDAAIAPLELDEDRHTLRGIARGIAASIAPGQRIARAIPTRALPVRRLGTIANAASFAELRRLLADHPLAPACDGDELFEIELALSRVYVAHVTHLRVVRRDRALATHLTQLVDTDNAHAALLLASRGGDLAPERAFVAGGRLLDPATFAAAAASLDAARERLARAFARTPLATALFAASPSALEDAALAWQLATQAHLRRSEPLGLAPVIHLVLRRRDEARRLRRGAWGAVLGGAA